VFVNTVFKDAILKRVVLTLSDLKGADVTNADFTDALLDKLQQQGLCKTASGTNPTTGADTRKSLGCGGRPRGSPSNYMTVCLTLTCRACVRLCLQRCAQDASSAVPEPLFGELQLPSLQHAAQITHVPRRAGALLNLPQSVMRLVGGLDCAFEVVFYCTFYCRALEPCLL